MTVYDVLNVLGPVWVVTGLAATYITGAYLHFDREAPTEQTVAAVILALVFAPLVILGLMGLGLYKGLPLLGRGFAGLYRSFFPAKVKLPKAQVL